MQKAVDAEELRRVDLNLLEVEERIQKDLEYSIQQETLKRHGPCRIGFSWHRQINGWGCAGGSHFVSENEWSNLS